jgi:hypothetical protein
MIQDRDDGSVKNSLEQLFLNFAIVNQQLSLSEIF